MQIGTCFAWGFLYLWNIGAFIFVKRAADLGTQICTRVSASLNTRGQSSTAGCTDLPHVGESLLTA